MHDNLPPLGPDNPMPPWGYVVIGVLNIALSLYILWEI